MNREYPLKLSIIVPVYNVEEYLERCIDSLLDQDIDKSEYEIIIVNDGSTDNSYEIAKRIAKENSNVVLASQENRGLSGARNTGLKHIRGKYILFVDSDDFFTPNTMGTLVQIAEANHLDLCFFRTVFERRNNIQTYGDKQHFDENVVYDGSYVMLNGMVISSVWQNLYSSHFLMGTGITFYEGIIHEDIDFNFRLYPLAKRIMFTPHYCYHYCVYRESILRTQSPQKIKYLIESDFHVANNIKKNVKTPLYSPEIQRFCSSHANSIVISNLIRIVNERILDSEMKLLCLETAKSLGVYPITERTNSWKTTILSRLLNCEWLFKWLIK